MEEVDYERLQLIMVDFTKSSSSSINFLQDLKDFDLNKIYCEPFPLKSSYYSQIKRTTDEEILNYFNFDKN